VGVGVEAAGADGVALAVRGESGVDVISVVVEVSEVEQGVGPHGGGEPR
jgi:hypothetical protein